MDRKTIKRILGNHRIVQFAEDLLNGIDQELYIAEYNDKYIIYVGDLETSKEKKEYIEFPGKSDAEDFVASYKKIFDEVPVEEMTQKEFVEMREAVKWQYEGKVDEEGNFTVTVEKVA
jgi:hypothetical protein